MIALDTNVLVRHLVRDEPDQHKESLAVMATLSPDRPGFVAELVAAELWWVLSRTYKQPRAALLQVLTRLLQAPELEFEDGESVFRAVSAAREGADFADALLGETAELFGCDAVVTFDKGAARALGWQLLGR